MKKSVRGKKIAFFMVFVLIVACIILAVALYYGLFSFNPKDIFKPKSSEGDNVINPIGSEIPQSNETVGIEGEGYEDMGEGKTAGASSDSDYYANIIRVPPAPNKTVMIASWNLYPLDDSKASNDGLMQTCASIISNFEIVFLQGITSSDAFTKLCSLLPTYNCRTSSPSGEAEGEQYGILYRKPNISLAEVTDYNPDSLNRWQHPPFEALFNISDYSFWVYVIHTNQDNVREELSYLEQIAATNGNLIVLGDLNADCLYYNPSDKTEFADWNWIITDARDTTVTSDDCAYDRIIINGEVYSEFMPYETGDGVYRAGIGSQLSNHYIVWAEIRPEEQS